MKSGLLVLMLCIASPLLAQKNYAVNLIDTALLRDANVVVRFEEQRYELKSVEKAIQSYRIAITVLNENGDEHANVVVPYSQLSLFDYLEGNLYDASGKKIRSLKKGEVKDISGSDGMSLADDVRFKHHSFYHRIYPYTVEYEYATIEKETMFFPNWFPQAREKYAVEESRFLLVLPSNYEFRHKSFNYPSPPEKLVQSDKATYQWVVKNLKAVKYSQYFPGWRYISPMVLTGATEFQIGNYKGNFQTWNDFGKFQLNLNQGRDVLPDAIREQVQILTTGKNSVREKVEALYHFLQKNTRYISIQLGVGGWQPFDASYVAKNKYGDCKALSNYMYSLLKEANIPSYYTIIRAGDDAEDIVHDFPSSQFNHVILCVPAEGDSIWLECTSQDQVAGYMGSFTGNRHALIVTPEGGKIVRTPTYNVRENNQVTKVRAEMDENGNLTVEQQAKYSGILQDQYHGMMNSLSRDRLKEFLNQNIDLSTFDVLEFNYRQDRLKVPVVHEQLKLAVNNYAQVTGKRVFVIPNITNRFSMKLPKEERNYPIKLRNAFAEVDSIEIRLPGGYSPEALPAPQTIESPFGKYSNSYTVDGNRLLYHRKFERYNGHFEKNLYNDLIKFYEQVYKADRSRVVLVKKD